MYFKTVIRKWSRFLCIFMVMKETIKWIIVLVLGIGVLFLWNKSIEKKDGASSVTVILQDSGKVDVSQPAPKIIIQNPDIDFSWIKNVQDIDSLRMALIEAVREAKSVKEYDSIHVVKNKAGDTLATAELKQWVTENRLDRYSLNIHTFNKETTIREQLKWGIYGGLQGRYDGLAKTDIKISLLLPKLTIGGFKQIGGPDFGISAEVPIFRNYK